MNFKIIPLVPPGNLVLSILKIQLVATISSTTSATQTAC
jgi:hypothetical protein